MMKSKVQVTGDPFAFEQFKNAIHSLADEMVLTICRTSYSEGICFLKWRLPISPRITARAVARNLSE